MESDDEGISGLGDGVKLDRRYQHRAFLPGGYASGPVRQPIGPPDGDALQHHAGFAKFLKAHLSPRHKRVTAGGRVVPAGPKSPPPTFHMEFIDSVVRASERFEKNASLYKPDLGIHKAEGDYCQHRMSLGTYDREAPATLKTITQSTTKAPLLNHSSMDESSKALPITERLPPGYQIQEIIDGQSAIVRSGSTTLYAHLNGDNLAFQTVDLVTPPSNTTVEDRSTAPISLLEAGLHSPHLLPNYQSMDGAITMPIRSVVGAGILSGKHDRHGDGTQPLYEFQSAQSDLRSNSCYANTESMGFKSGSAAASYTRGLHHLENAGLDVQLSEVSNAHNHLKEELNNLERFHALRSDDMPESQLKLTLVQKRQLVLQLDQLRRAKRDLELQQAGCYQVLNLTPVANVSTTDIPVQTVHAAQSRVPSTLHERRQAKKLLSPNAPSFIPSVQITDSASQQFGLEKLNLMNSNSPAHEENGTPLNQSDPSRSSTHSGDRASSADSMKANASQQATRGSWSTSHGSKLREAITEEKPTWVDAGTFNIPNLYKSREPPASNISVKESARASRSLHCGTLKRLTNIHSPFESSVGVKTCPQAFSKAVSASPNLLTVDSNVTLYDEVRAVPVDKAKHRERWRTISNMREQANEGIRIVESSLPWVRREGEGFEDFAKRCDHQREVLRTLRAQAEETESKVLTQIEAKTPFNTPFAGDRSYARHGFLALKAPSSIASPVFRAAGTIPSMGNSALPSFPDPHSSGHTIQTALRGGAGDAKYLNPGLTQDHQTYNSRSRSQRGTIQGYLQSDPSDHFRRGSSFSYYENPSAGGPR